MKREPDPVPIKQRCTGHSSRTGEPCKLWPVKGATVCHKHGGRAKQVKAKAEERLAEQRIRRAMATYGEPIEIDPAAALLAEVHRTAGHVAWLQEQVAQLDDKDVGWGKTRVKTGGEDHGTTEEAKPNAWLVLYQEERKHLVRVCAEAIRCGIEERRVKLAESQGQLVAGVIRAILGDLHLSVEQQAMVSEVVPRRLRELAA